MTEPKPSWAGDPISPSYEDLQREVLRLGQELRSLDDENLRASHQEAQRRVAWLEKIVENLSTFNKERNY